MNSNIWAAIFVTIYPLMGLMSREYASGQTLFHEADISERTDCALSEDQARWIQRALDGWERVTRDVLRVEQAPLPWIVLVGRSCAWHLAPDQALLPGATSVHSLFTFADESVPVRALPHDSVVRLPGGSTIPVQGVAFASLYEDASGQTLPFFVLALPEIWREHFPEDPSLEAEILGVVSHELVHTRHISHAARRIEEMKGRYELPERIHDDMVEERFSEVTGFRDAHDKETDLLYRAVAESHVERKRELVRQALDLIRARQDEYFRGSDAAYRELEELFLNMEGVAVWAAYTLSKTDPAFAIGIDAPGADRRRNSWS